MTNRLGRVIDHIAAVWIGNSARITGGSSSKSRTTANPRRPRETLAYGHRTRFRQRASGRLPDHQPLSGNTVETECRPFDSGSVRWLPELPDLLDG